MDQIVRRIRVVGVVALLALFTIVPVAGAAPLAQAADTVDVSDQPVANGGITLAAVNASQAGWIAVHLDEGGSPGRVIGHGPVKQGANSNVTIPLDENVAAGTKLWPMLHIDAGTIGTYEFPGPDAPVVVGGNIVMKQITITQAAAPAAPSAPSNLPTTGGADLAGILWACALAFLIAGVLLRRRA
jgi:hypothetical protein